MNVIEDKPQVSIATSGAIKSATYYAKRPLKIGDLVELCEDGCSVDALNKGNYLGIVIALDSYFQEVQGPPEISFSVCVLSEGRVEVPLPNEILNAPALTALKADSKGLSLAKPGELVCAYLLKGDHNWKGTAVLDFFYPPIPFFGPKLMKDKGENKI